jgi:hypothetical protein
MGTVTTFPNGQQLTSSALTTRQINILFQQITAQMLGVNAGPFPIEASLINGSFNATLGSTDGLYQGLQLTGTGLPDEVVQIDEVLSQTEILLSSSATSTVASTLTVIDPTAYAKVRLNWPTTGQPAFLITDDVCFIQAIEIDEEYGKIRDFQWPNNDQTSVAQTTTYTRVWRVSFVLYGPNSFDNARLIRSAVLLDFSHDFLAQSNVYLVPDTPSPRRVPEEMLSQWWERTDLTLRFNEFVTETIVVNSGSSVVISINDATGQVAEFTVPE